MAKIKIDNQMPNFWHNGIKLHALTESEAHSLDARDTIKYIGTCDNDAYYTYQRRAFKLQEKPKITYVKGLAKLTIEHYYSDPLINPITDWSLVERGDKYEISFRKAKKLVPTHIRRALKDIEAVRKSRVSAIDHYLDLLPLHMKLDVLKNLSKEEQELYEYISSPIELPKSE